ncbi:hypothetical protein IMCC14465_12230 [alpha proteobacterium IMCC14465]|uniref:DUF192 domain-containing protein n=1 Tax=alpha proteobacterium IMCC14465 TaxID=1220535 RepID=J9DWM1_9PROT|nr:hypothetical protein IMCC14465_12230 [alpha proteobacterium IMCC14465]
MRWLFLFLLPYLIFTPLSAQSQDLPQNLSQNLLVLTIETETKQPIADFKVELADTPEKMSRGLMYRTDLPTNQGMLFILGAPRIATFWMHNTFVPLDMIFIRLNGEIESIVTREDTLSQARTSSQKPVAYVLEINAGQSAALGIKPGHFIRLESGISGRGGR